MCVRALGAPSFLTALEEQKFSSEEQVTVKKKQKKTPNRVGLGSYVTLQCEGQRTTWKHSLEWRGTWKTGNRAESKRMTLVRWISREVQPVNCWKTFVVLWTSSETFKSLIWDWMSICGKRRDISTTFLHTDRVLSPIHSGWQQECFTQSTYVSHVHLENKPW